MLLTIRNRISTHDQLAQGQDKIRFQREGIVLVTVIQVDVHGIDVVVGGRRDFNDLSA